MSVFCECCRLCGREVCLTGRYLVKSSPAECVCVCVFSKPQQWDNLGPSRAVVAQEKKSTPFALQFTKCILCTQNVLQTSYDSESKNDNFSTQHQQCFVFSLK
jgi:hypothetical protein